jgi:hypothetical protein
MDLAVDFFIDIFVDKAQLLGVLASPPPSLLLEITP